MKTHPPFPHITNHFKFVADRRCVPLKETTRIKGNDVAHVTRSFSRFVPLVYDKRKRKKKKKQEAISRFSPGSEKIIPVRDAGVHGSLIIDCETGE